MPVALVLLVAAVVIARRIGVGEFSTNVDETFHACTGLYVASFLHDLPLRHPIEYTYAYYAHYPALDLIEYPPLFYTVEGFVFSLLGPSVISARLSILLFALLGLFFFFRLVEKLRDQLTAAVATVLLAFLPGMLLYEKSVMLEVPAMALCLGASYFWIRYLRDGGPPRLIYWFAVFAALALLTKAQAVYLAAWCVLSVAATGRWNLVLNKTTVKALLLSAIMVLPYYGLSFTFAGAVARANVLKGADLPAYPWLFYPACLPDQVGWALLALAILGVVTIRTWENRNSAALMITWIGACYLAESSIANKEARYIIYWLPPIVYMAVAPLISWLRFGARPARVIAGLTIGALVASYSAAAWLYERPYVSGYAQLAKRLTQEPGGYVLSDAPLDADFIFFMRAFDPARRFVIDRKALYAGLQATEYGYVELAHSAQDVSRIIREGGFRYILVDTKLHEFESQRALRAMLKTSQFKLLDEVPLVSNSATYRGDTLLLYKNMQASPPTGDTYRIRMLTLDHDIVVPRAALLPDK